MAPLSETDHNPMAQQPGYAVRVYRDGNVTEEFYHRQDEARVRAADLYDDGAETEVWVAWERDGNQIDLVRSLAAWIHMPTGV